MPRRQRRKKSPGASGRPAAGGTETPAAGARWTRLARWVVVILLVLVPLWFLPWVRDAFRAPKLWLAEGLGLLSLVLLSLALASRGTVRPLALLRRPAVQAVGPLLLAAFLAAVLSPHPQAWPGFVHLAVAGVVLMGWSEGFSPSVLRRLLFWTIPPAALLGLMAAGQLHGFQPLGLGSAADSRLAITALAGNPGDLGIYLALAAVLAQGGLWLHRRSPRLRLALGVALVPILYGLAASQTLTALLALAVGSLVLWTLLLVGGGVLSWRRFLPAVAALVVAGVVVILIVSPLRQRVTGTLELVRERGLNAALTGRLDGWRVAGEMVRQRPWTGVGPGAFEAAFGDAKLRLAEAGTPFYRGQYLTSFDHAHNDYLEALATWGLMGGLALGWGLLVVVRRLRRLTAEDAAEEPAERALAWAGVATVAVLALAQFPTHLALTGYPVLLLLAWILAPRGQERAAAAGPALGARLVAALLVAALTLVLVLHGLAFRDWFRAARILRTVEVVTQQLMARDQLQARLLWHHVRLLQEARRLNPLEAAIPLALGSQYRLLDRPEEAREAYAESLALETRPETLLNLGMVEDRSGREAAALESFTAAVLLAPRLRSQVPAEYRAGLPSRQELFGDDRD